MWISSQDVWILITLHKKNLNDSDKNWMNGRSVQIPATYFQVFIYPHPFFFFLQKTHEHIAFRIFNRSIKSYWVNLLAWP